MSNCNRHHPSSLVHSWALQGWTEPNNGVRFSDSFCVQIQMKLWYGWTEAWRWINESNKAEDIWTINRTPPPTWNWRFSLPFASCAPAVPNWPRLRLKGTNVSFTGDQVEVLPQDVNPPFLCLKVIVVLTATISHLYFTDHPDKILRCSWYEKQQCFHFNAYFIYSNC